MSLPSENRLLCEQCRAIPMNPQQLRKYDTKNLDTKGFNLGTLQRVRSSSCPVCELVCLAVDEEVRLSLSRVRRRRAPSEDIRLIWFNDWGPWNGAFHVDGSVGIDLYLNFADPGVQNAGTKTGSPTSSPSAQENHGRLDLQRVRAWITQCSNKHGKTCNANINRLSSVSDSYAGLELLRLIDVEDMCVIETKQPLPYLALSYVWGQTTSDLRLTSMSKSKLMTRRSLSKYRRSVPGTLRDALDLTRALGERYLWVDMLCLVQNDADDLASGIGSMDLIYEHALLTIAAASGHNAEAGLPGVGYSIKEAPAREVSPGVTLRLHADLDSLFQSSVYCSRTWTLQEHLLSRRVLYFIYDKIFFQCRSSTTSEECDRFFNHSQKMQEPTTYSPLRGAIQMRDAVSDFDTILSSYSRRALSHQEDALNAMAGVIRRFSSRMKSPFLQGLPAATLDHSILFRRDGSAIHRREHFPSYSWTGWRGPLRNQEIKTTSINRWLTENTWIEWYFRDADGAIKPVWDSLAYDGFPVRDLRYAGYRKRLTFQKPAPLPFSVTQTLPTSNPKLAPKPKGPLLQFWTLAALFYIDFYEPLRGYADILTVDNERCGKLLIDGFERYSGFFESADNFEVIALSICGGEGVSGWDEEFPNDLSSETPYYNVMLLDWKDGVAERRGIGFIEQVAIIKGMSPGPTWKEIVLG